MKDIQIEYTLFPWSKTLVWSAVFMPSLVSNHISFCITLIPTITLIKNTDITRCIYVLYIYMYMYIRNCIYFL